MLFGNPVEDTIHLKQGVTNGRARWYRSQPWGPVKFDWEPPLGPYAHFNRGVDIARGPAGCGDPALAVQDGTVIYRGGIKTTINGVTKYSLAAIIYHGGGHATGIGHLQSFAVAQGRRVEKGQKIGAVGATGWATGCHIDLVYKTDFPASLAGVAAANAFYWDAGSGGKGKLTDIWPQFEQNVLVRPKPGLAGVNIRTKPTLVEATRYAVVEEDLIRRLSDDKDIGDPKRWRKWDGTVRGDKHEVNGKTSRDWERMFLDGAYRNISSLLSVKSAS